MPKPDTRETFIAKARQKHGTKYDYSRVRYVNSTTAVEIVCPVHGVFTQTPNKHLQGKGCRACGYESNAEDKRKSTEQFIEEARRVHGDRYGYEKTVYLTKESKVIITCPEHGEFRQLPYDHLDEHAVQGIIPMDERTAAPSEANVQGFLEQAERMERESKPRNDNEDIFDQNDDTEVPF